MLTFVTVLAATTAVVTGSLVPVRNAVSKSVIDAELSVDRWLRQRGARPGLRRSAAELLFSPAEAPREAGKHSAAAAARSAAPRNKPAAPRDAEGRAVRRSVDYFLRENEHPKLVQVPGIPWLKREPRVLYSRPRRIPESLLLRYRSLEGAIELMKEPRGLFETGPEGTTYLVQDVPKQSYLSSVVGLRPGDRILSINGHRIVGVGLSAAKAIYNEIRDATRFAVKVERDGQVRVMSFTVKNKSR